MLLGMYSASLQSHGLQTNVAFPARARSICMEVDGVVLEPGFGNCPTAGSAW